MTSYLDFDFDFEEASKLRMHEEQKLYFQEKCHNLSVFLFEDAPHKAIEDFSNVMFDVCMDMTATYLERYDEALMRYLNENFMRKG